MTTSIQADSFFQICIQNFSEAFGIQDPSQLEAQKRAIIPEYVEIDTVVSFPDDFDFTTLQDRIFPFWGKENVVEYKAINDTLAPMHLYKYGLTELGILATHLLSKPREDRKERKDRQPLSQKKAKALVNRLTTQGAQHTCCNTIITTADPVGLRKGCCFEAVDTYDHLKGALYRRTICNDVFVGHLATYLVVVNQLPVGYPINAPLLLLSTGDKQTEFCNWLLEAHEGLTLAEREHYITYLVMYELVQNLEVKNKMSKKIGINLDVLVELVDRLPETREQFMRRLYQGEPIKLAQTILQTDSPLSAAQAMLQADSPLSAAQAMLQADSPVGAAQAMLQVDSPLSAAQAMLQTDSPLGVVQAALQTDSLEEAALKLIQNQEQFNRFLELYLKQNKVKNGELENAEESS